MSSKTRRSRFTAQQIIESGEGHGNKAFVTYRLEDCAGKVDYKARRSA